MQHLLQRPTQQQQMPSQQLQLHDHHHHNMLHQHQQQQQEQQQQQHSTIHHLQKSITIEQPKSHVFSSAHECSDSRATSVAVEPGSVRGSAASVSGQLRCSLSHPPESLRSGVDDTAPTEQGVR